MKCIYYTISKIVNSELKDIFMNKEKLMQNATTNRIIQTINLNNQMTTLEIQRNLPEISQTTLYRYMKYMEDCGVVEVINKEKVRGQIEKTYKLKSTSIDSNISAEDALISVDLFLKQVYGKYQNYFSTGYNLPKEDMLFMKETSFLLNNKEYDALCRDIKEVLNRYTGKDKTPDRKIRNLYIISTPEEEPSLKCY